MMKKYYILIASMLLILTSQAQTQIPDWEISLESNVQWMEINDWGILLVSANDGLYGINPNDGKQLWKIADLTAMKREGYRSIQGTPVSLLEDGPLLIALNGLSGQVIMHSQKAGFEKVVSSQPIAETGGLLIEYKNGKEKGLALFDLISGELKWQNALEGLRGGSEITPKPRVDLEGNIYYGYGKNLLKLDANTGEITWQYETSKDIKDLFFDPETTLIVAVDGSVSNAFRRDNTEGETSTVQGNTGKFTIQAIGLGDGKALWSNDYKSKYAGSAAGPEDFIVFHAFSINFIDFKTGALKWKKEPKYVGGGRNTGLIVDNSGIIYAMESAITEGKTYIYSLDVNGNEKWKKAPYTGAGIYRLERVPSGILYVSPTSANIVNETTGKVLWEEDKYLNSGGIPILYTEDENGNPMLLVRGSIVRILPEKGDWETFATDVQLVGEQPVSFDRVAGGYRITSPQNVLMIDDSGKRKYRVTYPPVEQSLGQRMLLNLAGNVMGVTSLAVGLTAMNYGIVGELQNNDDYRAKSSGYFDLFQTTIGISDAFYASAQRRFGEEINAPDYKLILTQKEKNIGLVKVNLKNGKEDGFVVTEDRTPEYVLDPVENKLFFKTAAKRIAAYKM